MGLLVGFFIVALLFGGLGFALSGVLQLIVLGIAACAVFWMVVLAINWRHRKERAERQRLEDETWDRWLADRRTNDPLA